MKAVRIGTRGSQLALTQTQQVMHALQTRAAGLALELVVIRTTGDTRQNIPFAEVGTKGMFVKEIEEALLDGAIDVAVHSMKDMPSEVPAGLVIGCVPPRQDARDALVSGGRLLADLPPGSRVGTSSLRRQAQLRAVRSDLSVEELRGNLDTRLRRLTEGRYDAIVLAAAGMERMGWASRITERLGPEIMVPAPGQGALALECRADDTPTRALLARLDDADASDAADCERGFQAALGAGCTVPAGALAVAKGSRVRITALVAAPDGSRLMRTDRAGPRVEARTIGAAAASELLDRGAGELLQSPHGT